MDHPNQAIVIIIEFNKHNEYYVINKNELSQETIPAAIRPHNININTILVFSVYRRISSYMP